MRVEAKYSKEPYNEAVQKNSNSIKLLEYNGNNVSKDMNTFYDLYWNDKGFYARFLSFHNGQIKFCPKETEILENGKTFKLWVISEVCEIFISHAELEFYREFEFAPDGRFLDIAIENRVGERKTDFYWVSNLEYKSEIHDDYWEGFVFIPWTAFENKIPKVGDIWHGNFYRILTRDEKELYLAWSPVYKINFHQPQYFGDIIFVK